MDNLIFDRLKTDVENALNNPSSVEFLKGAYNYTDLNRVEQWCEYIQNLLNDYGKNIDLKIKTNWNLRDYPTRTQIDRIRGNIDYLKDMFKELQTETIEYVNTLDFEKANILEKIIYDVHEYIKEMTRTLELQYNFGTTLIKKKYITLKGE